MNSDIWSEEVPYDLALQVLGKDLKALEEYLHSPTVESWPLHQVVRLGKHAGVLSSNRRRDFEALGALVELGYGFAYRVLDAGYSESHKDEESFVVGHFGDWKPASKVV
jgi:NADH/NAD ratio-sensing transcriptional regulator Rex